MEVHILMSSQPMRVSMIYGVYENEADAKSAHKRQKASMHPEEAPFLIVVTYVVISKRA